MKTEILNILNKQPQGTMWEINLHRALRSPSMNWWTKQYYAALAELEAADIIKWGNCDGRAFIALM